MCAIRHKSGISWTDLKRKIDPEDGIVCRGWLLQQPPSVLNSLTNDQIFRKKTPYDSDVPPVSTDFSTDIPLPFSPYMVELPVDSNSNTSSLTI
jgi:hypothetical protein